MADDRTAPPARIHIAQPEPGLTPEAMVERAAALRPLLRAGQDEADRRGCYSDEVHEAIRKAGLYRILQPKMFGGYQFRFPVFQKVIMEIARGHPGSAWCYTLASSHALVAGAYFPEDVQIELFGESGEFRSPHRSVPGGTFTRTDGGYMVTGTWGYSSGSPVSTHFMGGGIIKDEGQEPRGVNFVVPREKIEILNDWGDGASLGMDASGSHTVKLTDVFVPDRHIFTDDILMTSDAFGPEGLPGYQLHKDPLYVGVVGGCYQSTFSAMFVGAARAALDDYDEAARSTGAFRQPGLKRYQDYEVQAPFGRALTLADSAEAITLSIGETFMEQCERWARDRTPITTADTMKLWALSKQAAQMACEAIELLFHTSPVRAANRGQKMQRYFRDAQMYRIHPSAQMWVEPSRARAFWGDPIGRFGR